MNSAEGFALQCFHCLVCMCVCLSVCLCIRLFPLWLLQRPLKPANNDTHGSLRLFLDFDSWIFEKTFREKANMQMSWSSTSAVFAYFRDKRNAGTTRRTTGQSRVASSATGSTIVDGPEVYEDPDSAQREAEGPRASMDYSEFTLLDLSTSTIIFATDCTMTPPPPLRVFLPSP